MNAMRNGDAERRARGSGRTTEQMRASAIGTIYVIPRHASASYFKTLTAELKRLDIRIIKPEHLLSHRGFMSPVVIDHATTLRPEEADIAQMINAKAEARRK